MYWRAVIILAIMFLSLTPMTIGIVEAIPQKDTHSTGGILYSSRQYSWVGTAKSLKEKPSLHIQASNYANWSLDEPMYLWRVFNGKTVNSSYIANTSRWGLVNVFVGYDSLVVVKVEEGPTPIVNYIYAKSYGEPITGSFVGDINNDNYDEIVLTTQSQLIVVGGRNITLSLETIEGLAVGNMDSDYDLEFAVITSFPRIYLLDYPDFYEIGKINLDTGYKVVKAFVANISNTRTVVIVRKSLSSTLSDIEGYWVNGTNIFSFSVSADVYDAELLDSNGDGMDDSIVLLERTDTSYSIDVYDISSSTPTQKWAYTLTEQANDLMVYEFVGSLTGEEVFIAINQSVIIYSADGVKWNTVSGAYTIYCLSPVLSQEKIFAYGNDNGEIVTVNASLLEKGRIKVSGSSIRQLAVNMALGRSLLLAVDQQNIAYYIDSTGGELTEITNFLVAGKITYVAMSEAKDIIFIAGLFPFIYGLSRSGRIVWSIPLNGYTVRAIVDQQSEEIFLADSEGYLYNLTFDGTLEETRKLRVNVYGLAYSDIDNDYKKELVIGAVNGTTGYIMVLDNGNIINATIDGLITDIGLMDFDSDSYTDILISVLSLVGSSYMIVYEYDGTAVSPVSSPYYLDLNQGLKPFYIATGDYDGDGHLDAVVLAKNSTSTAVYRVDRNGFSQPYMELSGYIFENIPYLPSKPIGLVDFTGDGKDDMVFGVKSSSDSRIYFVDFSDPVKGKKYMVANSNINLYDIEPGDFNNNGMTDIMLALSNGSIMLLEDNFFEATIIVPTHSFVPGTESFVVDNLDTDNDTYSEFVFGGDYGVAMMDYYHLLYLGIENPENITDVFYYNKTSLQLVWAAGSDIDLVGYSILVNSTTYAAGLAPNTTSYLLSLDEGIHNVTLLVRTAIVEFRGSISFLLVIDLTPPTLLMLQEPAEYTNQTNIVFSWNTTDDLSGISRKELYLNGSLYVLDTDYFKFIANTSGLYIVKIKIYDRAGNSVERAYNIHVDLISPVISIDSPSSDTVYTNDLAYSLVLSWTMDDNIGIDKVYALVDGTVKYVFSGTTTTCTITGFTEGKHTVTIRVVDFAGNYDEDSINVVIDTTPPVIQAYRPENNSAFSEPNIIVSYIASDDLSGIKMVKIYFDNLLHDTKFNMSAASTPLDLSALEDPEGTHNITIIAMDWAGNQKAITIQFIYDKTKPTAKIETPTDNSVVGTNITIKWYASDALSGVNKTELWIDNKLLTYKIYGGQKEVKGAVSVTLAEGNHTIRLIVVDSAGNYEVVKISVKVEISAGMDQTTTIIITVLVIGAVAVATFFISKKFLKKRRRRRLME